MDGFCESDWMDGWMDPCVAEKSYFSYGQYIQNVIWRVQMRKHSIIHSSGLAEVSA